MNILITGGTGFIGLPVVERLIEDTKLNVLVVTRQKSVNLRKSENLEWVQADIENIHKIQKKIECFQPEVFIHLAWDDIPDFSLASCSKNLNQSINLFEFIFSLKSCKKILLSGSCFEYINPVEECYESQYTEPKDYFTWAKLSLLSYLKIKTKDQGICLGWFRVFYAYGPRQRKESLIPIVIDNLTKGRLPKLKTPNNYNDYIFVQDIADIFSISVTKEFPSGVYNIGSGHKTSVLEVCEIAESIALNQSSLSSQLQKDSIEVPVESSFYASTKLTEEIFSWKAKTSLRDGIEITYKNIDHD